MNQFEQEDTQEGVTDETLTQHPLDESNTEIEETEEHSVSRNMIILVVLAIVVVVLALMYIWGASLEEENMEDQVPVVTELTTVAENENVETLPQLSDSDELEAIEADLDTTSTTNLDAELTTLETELDAALQE